MLNNRKFKQTEIGEIPEDWNIFKLGDIAKSISETYQFDNNPVVFLNTSDVLEGKVLNFKSVSSKGLPGQAKKKIKTNDILFSEIRPANKRFAYINFNVDNFVVSTKLMVIRSLEKVNSQFLYLILTSPTMLEKFQILAESRSGTFPQITFDSIKNIEIPLPPLNEQQEIVKTILSLDDKIELNINIIKNLEQTAQALFKHWFVDFEFPNESSQPYKSSGGEMIDSELGQIPKGWSIDNLGNLTNIINGFAFKSEDYQKDGVFLLRTRNFTDSGYVVKNEIIFLPNDFYEKYKNNQLQKFDVLLVMVGASVGRLGFVTSHALPALQNQNMWCFRTKNTVYQLFLKQLMESIIKNNLGSVSGSARDFFRKDYFRKISIILPSEKIINQFDNIIRSMYNKIDLCLQENINLTNTRDLLLPKLLSGKISV